MHELTEHLLTRRDQALQATASARRQLIHLLEHGETQLAAAIAEVCNRQAYDSWWKTVTDHIEHGGQHPMTALTNARTTARQVLLDLTTPRQECPFAYGQAIAALEATRRFYHETNTLNLEAITHPQPATPTIATGPGTTSAITARRPR